MPNQSPSLGLIIKHLKECTDGYGSALETYQQHKKKVESVGSLTTEEIRQLLPSSALSEKLSLPQQQGLARKRLQKLTVLQQQELQQFAYYYAPGVSSAATDSTFDLSALSYGVKLSDLEQLKTDAGKCITDGLFKKLLDMEEAQLQTKAEMRVGFVQALVRRIRCLMKLKAAAKPIL